MIKYDGQTNCRKELNLSYGKFMQLVKEGKVERFR
jgi:hypothetical protein